MIIQMLKVLAQKDALSGLVEKAQEKKKSKLAEGHPRR